MKKLYIFVASLFITSTIIFAAEGSSTTDSDTIKFQSMDGESFEINEIVKSGQNVALVFWQTWCSVCKREAPQVVEASKTHGDKIRFFGVISGSDEDVDDKKVEKLAKKLELPYPQVRDRDLMLTQRYEVKGTPTIVIIGKDLMPVYNSHKLPSDWTAYYPSLIADSK